MHFRLKAFGVFLAVAIMTALGFHASPASATQGGPSAAPPRIATHAGSAKAGVHSPKGKPVDQGTRSSKVSLLLTGPYYAYNEGHQNLTAPATAGGIQAGFNVGDPTIASGAYHSLAEAAATKTINGQPNIVEIGWIKSTAVCGGTGGPCLFAFWWKNGVGTCYNGCGWVDYAGNSMNLGAALTPGTTYTFGIQWDAASTAWWLYSNTGTGTTSNWLGYFDDTLWTANNAYGAPVTGFTSVDRVQVFGEVAEDDDFGTGLACTDMGNGRQGSSYTAPWAYASDPVYISSATLVAPSAGLTTSLTSNNVPALYTGYSTLWPGTPPSTRTFYFGGPADC